jgi:hypothetical protein
VIAGPYVGNLLKKQRGGECQYMYWICLLASSSCRVVPPKYRLHRERNLAVVTFDGKGHYLGPYGSPELLPKRRALI